MKRSIAVLAIALAPLLATAQSFTPINTVLIKDLTVSRAKVGDTIKVVSYSGFTAANGVRVPPGSTLLGHVTDASKRVKHIAPSRLGIVFDQAQLASGQLVPIHMGVAGVSAAPQPGRDTTLDSIDPSLNQPMPSQTRSGPSAPVYDTVSNVRVGAPNPANPLDEQLQRHPSPSPVPARRISGTALLGSSIPGITLQASATTMATMVSTSRNISLDKGTPLVLLTIPQ